MPCGYGSVDSFYLGMLYVLLIRQVFALIRDWFCGLFVYTTIPIRSQNQLVCELGLFCVFCTVRTTRGGATEKGWCCVFPQSCGAK
jgi:hypothetical protein